MPSLKPDAPSGKMSVKTLPTKTHGNDLGTGEGSEKYVGTKSDTSLPQHGGEGQDTGKGSDMGLLKNTPAYRGPGESLKQQ